jgi:hypothetical protein
MNNKQSMKLYTEEQVKMAIQMADKYNYLITLEECGILNQLTPIELPSDEEIDEESPYVPNDASIDFWSHKEGFVDGAKWMRNKIQGGNK